MRPVRVVYRKYDGSLHWHQWMHRLGEDRYGLWLGAPADSTAQRGSEPPVVFADACVMLLPRQTWWTAAFNDRPPDNPTGAEIYCDITTPVEFTDDVVTMVDLDLDVIRRVDGSVVVDDEDEFAEHQVSFGYPPDVIAAAEASCEWLVSNIAGTEPFASAYKPYLDRVR